MAKRNVNILKIGTEKIRLGERKKFQLEVGSLYAQTKLNIPIEVIRGKEDGPTLFISAAIHGDEINGVEILKRLLQRPVLNRLKGTLIAVPVVNVFGFNNKSRYLPDRRDLNRSFPGSSKGSLASRLAYIFTKEIVNKCTHGIDLHTGAIHRSNLSQIRACLDDPITNDIAKQFGVPVLINSQLRDGSLREAARKKNVKMLLFEGGEALRFNENVIKSGLNGCLSVMRYIGMLPPVRSSSALEKRQAKAYVAKDSFWVRAGHSGSFRSRKKLGDSVVKGDILAVISDPFGAQSVNIVAPEEGIVVGKSTIPLVNRGDAVFHVATFRNVKKVKTELDL